MYENRAKNSTCLREKLWAGPSCAWKDKSPRAPGTEDLPALSLVLTNGFESETPTLHNPAV